MKPEVHKLSPIKATRFRHVVGAATASGSSRLAKVIGKVTSSTKSLTGPPNLSLNKRLLAIIKEPIARENSHDSLVELVKTPSLELLIKETACSAKPPSLPRRQVSMDLSFTEESTSNKDKGEKTESDLKHEQQSPAVFDRFVEETLPCNKAPPSKPFKRASMAHGFRDSMTSTISGITTGSSFDGSYQSEEDETEFSFDC
jgi:hypothetical protein